VRRLRHDYASAGFDDFLANLGGHNTGLRVPSQAVGAVSHKPLDYLFLLQAVDVEPDQSIVGVAPLLTIAAPQTVSESDAPLYPYEVAVSSPLWRFPDAFSHWFLTVEGKPPPGAPTATNGTQPADSDSFVFRDASTSALVYETVHFPVAPAVPGYLGLDDYTAPPVQGSVFLEFRDLRGPWTDVNTFRAARWRWNHSVRVRFYLRLRQTDPATRLKLPLDTTIFAAFPGSFAPEDGYLTASQNGSGSMDDTLQYWRCAGRILLAGELGNFNAG
jgi:hypothetical protein